MDYSKFKMKNDSLFITATNTDIGKTYTALRIIEHYQKLGLKVGVLKPIETGVIDIPLDASKLFNLAVQNHPDLEALGLDYVVPYQFSLPAAPSVAKGDAAISIDLIIEHYKKIVSVSDITLVEGAGGLLVPIENDFYMIDLIKLLELKTLLVTSSKLGSINDTLLSIEALRSRQINFDWVVNIYQDADSFQSVTAPFYNEHFGGYKTLDLYLNEDKR